MKQLFEGSYEWVSIVIPAVVAFIAIMWLYPHVLKIAKDKNIVDNPDFRKLQRVPIPILGGLSVVFGIMCGVMCFNLFGDFHDLLPVFAAMTVILLVGFVDDVAGLSPKVRFVFEILLVLFLVLTTGNQINCLHGLWGVETLPDMLSIPLTIFACVGIINAVNLIDGVDGYSSGYCTMACLLFGSMFYIIGDVRMVALAAIVAASLVPFFIHNVCGKSSKMFIGDAGTLSLGVIMSTFVCNILAAKTHASEVLPDVGLIPFTLAVMCVPIFDTLRVMSARILRGQSPFSADKTHLHHLFIELGFSHIGTTVAILTLNFIVVLCWLASYLLGASIDLQLYIVILLGLCITFVFYRVMRIQIAKESALYRVFRAIGRASHIERKGIWMVMQRIADSTAQLKEENATEVQEG